MSFSETILKLSYIRSTLVELHDKKVAQVSRVAVIREILGPVHYEFETDISTQNSRSDGKRKRRSSSSEVDFVPFKHKKVTPINKTFLTPVVNNIAKDLFRGSLEVSESDHYEDESDAISVKQCRHKAHHTNPAKIIWGERLTEDFYSNAIVDGVVYEVS